MSYRIDSIEDDRDIARIIKLTLEKQGYEVLSFPDIASFEKDFPERKPDLILLDLMLPDGSGLELLKKIRENPENDTIQVMIVSAKNATIDKVDGLDLGADDYLEKPFDLLELISRVGAKARRKAMRDVIDTGKLHISLSGHTVEEDGKEIHLTPAEFELLSLLVRKPGEAVNREKLMEALWGKDADYESRAVDVHINSLRSKLGEEGDRIVSVYGVGYRIEKEKKE